MPEELCVARVPIFRGLSLAEQRRVASLARPTHVRAGEIVYAPGSPLASLLVVHSGRLKVAHVERGGKEQVLRTVGEGDVLGERAFLTGHVSPDTVVALEDARLCVLRHADLAVLLRQHPDIAWRMLTTLSDRLYSTERLLAAVTSRDVEARVAAYLLDLPGVILDGVATVTLPMAMREVASYLGMRPETLSRRLATLAEAGVIEKRGRRQLAILDIDALTRAASPE